MAILVTGGAGYIGSHTVVELQSAGYDVVVVDNLCNSSEKALDRVSKITGKPVKFYKADILVTTQDKWYGVTYKEDKPVVVAAIQNLKDQGLYPQGLWD